MLLRLLKADLARGRAVAAVLVGLVTLAVALASASASLIIDTVSAADRLSERARVPDLVQMHTGEADSRAIAQWADSRADVEDHMVMRTLPVPRAQFSIGGAVQASSYLEPAFVTAPERIDLLLDENGDRVLPGPGQAYLPVHYKAAGLAQAGDTVTVDTGEWRIDLRVAGFLRDAQMNAAMVPSKRLVVNPEDFSSLDEHIGEVEYLIEFDLADGASAAAVSEQYKAAGLPSTGIAVTAAQIQLMNALSTMLIAAVALVVAGVLAAVAVLALRYTVLAALEADLPQVAVLKAIGAPRRASGASTRSSTRSSPQRAAAPATRCPIRWPRPCWRRPPCTSARRRRRRAAPWCPFSWRRAWWRWSSAPRGWSCAEWAGSVPLRRCAAGPVEARGARASGGGSRAPVCSARTRGSGCARRCAPRTPS